MNGKILPYGPLPPEERISVRINEASRLTGLSRTTLYRLIGKGDLQTSKIGRSTVILMESLRAYITSNCGRR